MRLTAASLACLMAAVIGGCGGEPSTTKLPPPSHGGTMAALTGGRGFVEILTESKGSGRSSRQIQIIAYFYQPDGSTTLTSPPTDVTVKVGTSEKGLIVPLVPDPKAGVEQKFASQPGPYPAGFAGKIEAKLNGEPVDATVLFR